MGLNNRIISARSAPWAGRNELALAVLFVVIAIASQAWHPFLLGFYHDDWGLFVQPRLHAQDFHFFGTWHLDRPGYAVFSKLLLDNWDGGTVTFHLIKITCDLLAAAGIGWTILVYQKAFDARSVALAASGVAFWLVAPWSLGYSLWGTSGFTNISVLFLCLSAISLARWIEQTSRIMLAAAAVTFGVSVFFYQSTWLAIFPFVLVLAVRELWRKRSLGPIVIAGLALAAVQLGSIALSWWYSPKHSNPQMLWLFRENLKSLKRLGLEHFGKTGNSWLMGVLLVATLTAIVILWRRGGAARIRAIASVILLSAGIVITSALYASAGYDFPTSGLFSRTTQMVDFWVAVGGSILFAPSLGEGAARFRYLGLALSLFVVGACALAYWPAAKPWVRSWELQQAILAKSGPIADALQDGDVVLTDVPLDTDRIVVFGAPWDITGAVLVHNADRRPDLARKFPTVQIVPPLNLPMSWAPGEFTIMPGWTLPGTRLLLWRWQDGTIATVDHPAANRAELMALLATARSQPRTPVDRGP